MRSLFMLIFLMAPFFAEASVSVNESGFKKHGEVIFTVAKVTNTDPMELTTIISIESEFKEKAKNKGGKSSAAGLGGWTDRTWRATLKEHGSKYGLSMKTKKTNPKANVLMLAESLKDNRAYLKSQLKRNVTTTDVYTVHFLGTGGGVKLIKAKGNRKASAILPSAAASNRSIFYTRSGKARTVDEVRAVIKQKVIAHRSAYREQVVLTAFKHQFNI